MNVIEKILEEIIDELKEEGIIIDDEKGNRAVEIIHSHMDEVKNDDWIPVEERLPENYKYVLVQFRRYYSDEEQMELLALNEQGEWFGELGVLNGKAIAWQPLPEPYKAE